MEILKVNRFAILVFLLISVLVTVEAQLFLPFQSFRVIRTEKFDIIFPGESEASARLLATYADSVYEEISSILGIEVTGRIPVTFAPHTDVFNGYYSSFPSSHIVLLDTAMDLEWTTFEDNLKGLFIHELVHAITLNTRELEFRNIHRIFGNWVSPALWNAPLFMVEGAAISFESLSGFGRSNDPLTKHKLRQAIHEDRFLTPFQASGIHDSSGQRFNFYEYGGLFSTWLQQQYGMEKYAELWQDIGDNSYFSFTMYRSGFYRIFRRVYRIDFIDVWNAFRDSLALNGIEEAPADIFPARYRFFSENRNSFSALAARGTEVFILNRTEEKIHVYDTHGGNIRTFNTGSVFSYDLDVSTDGKTLLVSGYHLTGDLFPSQRGRAVVIEHRADSGRRTGRSIQGLYNARYFRDGVIGIAMDLHNNSIVYKDFNGNKEILFRGNERLMFSRPQVVDNDRIVFIAARNGVRELLLYNYGSGELFRIENYDDDNDYWRFMRGLSVSEGKLFFSHNVNDRIYKLASIDLEIMQAVFSNRDFSGGVFNPVSVNGSVYYRANFFSGDGILRFPETASSLSGTRINIKFVTLDAEDYGLIAGGEPQIPGPVPTDFLRNGARAAGDTRPYFAIRYMNPFDFWFPIPLMRPNHDNDLGFTIDGGGFITAIADPTDRHLIIAQVYADLAYRMASGIISWQNTIAGFPVTLEALDMVELDSGNDPYRNTRLSLNASFSQTPGRWSYGLSVGANYVRIAKDGGETAWETAYNWETTNNAFFYSIGISFSNLRRRQHDLFGTGMHLGIRGANSTGTTFHESFQPRFETRFRTAAEIRFPLNLVLYGAYDSRGMNIYGVSQVYGSPLFGDVASTEYAHPRNLNLSWIGGGEVSLGLFSFEIQRNLSHLYFNRIFGTLSVRNVLYDGQDHPDAEGIEIGDIRLAQSLVLRFRLTSSFFPVIKRPVFIEPNIWGAWKFSNTITGKGNPWNFGAGFTYRF